MGTLHRRQWAEPASYAVAFASLLFLVWASGQVVGHPDVGASWSLLTGEVERVSAAGPAFGRLRPGDRVLGVDGLPLRDSLRFPGKLPGEAVEFLIERDGTRRTVVVRLIRPSIAAVLPHLRPVLVALAFWSLGVTVLAFRAPDKPGGLFFLFCQLGGWTLASGAVSAIGPPWNTRLFGLLLWWLGPLLAHLHLHFPVPLPPRYSRRLPVPVYILTAAGSLFDLAIDPLALHPNLPLVHATRRLWLVLTLLLVVFLLAWAYRRAVSPEARRQVGVVALGGGTALAPVLVLSVLPDALLHQPALPYEVTLPFLLAIPLAYGYAIQRYRLLRLDRHVSRGAAAVLVVTLLGGLYLAVIAALTRLLPLEWRQHPAADLALVLVLAAAFSPLHRRLQIIVNRLFYGGWYDYRSAVGQLVQVLGRTGDPAVLAQAIQATMQLECACLLLPDRAGALTTAGQAGPSCPVHRLGALCLEADGQVGRQFQARACPLAAETLRRLLAGRALSGAERHLVACDRARLWIPLSTSDHLFGLFILGRKRGGAEFDANDLDILQVVAWQAGVAVQNARLLAERQQQALENERLHRQALRAREDERKRVSRELHDQIVQALIGLDFHLADLRNPPDTGLDGAPARLQGEVRHMLNDVRRICSDLRPPTLDSLGLVAAVRARLRALHAEGALEVGFAVDGDPDQDLPEEVAVCLYRALQEALLNVQKHAAARRVDVTVQLCSDEVLLRVADDGRGFVVPPRLGLLTNEGHFGLMGLRERLELVNGTLKVITAPGHGTRLEARVPLAGVPTG